ncbi:MAG: hypothetical protein C4344_05165 [Acidimicrobiia bacterium]
MCMRRVRRILAIVVVAAVVLVSGGGAMAAEQATLTSVVREAFVQRMRAHGVDPAILFEAPAELTVSYPDGTARTYWRPFGEVIERLMPPVVVGEGAGPAGTPEVLVGNTTHLFGHFYQGPTSGAGACGRLTVTTSSVIPEAPFVPVSLAPLYLTPVPGALSPVIPPSSWMLPLYVAGGRVKHIHGSYNLFGFHTAGTLIGSGASTDTGAPDPYPVWLPMVTSMGLVRDWSIDFVGHAQFYQATARIDFFGFTICGTVGGMLLSDGVAIFDNRPLAPGLPVIGLPDIP